MSVWMCVVGEEWGENVKYNMYLCIFIMFNV